MFKKILEPSVGDIVLYKDEQGYITPVKIIEGAFFKNERVSNFWNWMDILINKIYCGYGNFYLFVEKGAK